MHKIQLKNELSLPKIAIFVGRHSTFVIANSIDCQLNFYGVYRYSRKYLHLKSLSTCMTTFSNSLTLRFCFGHGLFDDDALHRSIYLYTCDIVACP